jgi:hypothetical protein
MAKWERITLTAAAAAIAFALEHASPSSNLAINVIRSVAVGWTVSSIGTQLMSRWRWRSPSQ